MYTLHYISKFSKSTFPMIRFVIFSYDITFAIKAFKIFWNIIDYTMFSRLLLRNSSFSRIHAEYYFDYVPGLYPLDVFPSIRSVWTDRHQ